MVTKANAVSADPRNYQLPGKVAMWFRKKGSTSYADWKEFGNIVTPSIEPLLTYLDHWSQRRGQRSKDRHIISERSAQFNFAIDEINLDNLMFMCGYSGTPQANTYLRNNKKNKTNPQGGNVIDLGETNIVGASVVVRDVRLENPTTYTLTTDYTVNAATGEITIVAAGALDNPAIEEVNIFWQKQFTTQSFELWPGEEIEGEARFDVFTPGGLQEAYELPNVVVKNNGAITQGDGTTWKEVPLQLEVLTDEDGELGHGHVVNEADELP